MQKKANKPKKLSRKEWKALKLADLRALEANKVAAAKADVAKMADHERRIAALEQKAGIPGLRGEKGEKGETGATGAQGKKGGFSLTG